MYRLARTARLTLSRARRGLCLLAAVGMAASVLLAAGGCTRETTNVKTPARYTGLKAREGVPDYLRGTIWERTQRENNTAYTVSGYGLVGQLRGTGDSTAKPAVRAYMTKMLAARGFGDPLNPYYGRVTPGQVLQDKNYAIVRVDGEVPPGARKGDWIDARVSCLPENRTISLAHGTLFEADLKKDGARDENPGGAVNVHARAKGPILVNPAYALTDAVVAPGAAKQSLRGGVVMANCLVMQDRPILLRLRNPEKRMSRVIEYRIQERFQNDVVGDIQPAMAYDEGYVSLFLPKRYKGDWEHFVNVAEHLYLDSDPGKNAGRCKALVEAAQQPDAYLRDISYCWEAIGKDALPFVMPLLTHAGQDVAFAAARAAASIGDNTGAAEARLVQMARTVNHPHAIDAVQALGGLPPSSALNHMLRDLLDSDQARIRIEAYRILARNNDPAVYTKVIAPYNEQHNQKFALDIVPSEGPPLIYATRRGHPRIAIIGKTPELLSPLIYKALNNRFTISTSAQGRVVTMFYRDETSRHEPVESRLLTAPVKVFTQPDVPEVIARLGGAGDRGEQSLNFTYGEVLSIVQELADGGKFIVNDGSKTQLATFVLQEAPRIEQLLDEAPIFGDVPAAAPAAAVRDDDVRPAGPLPDFAPAPTGPAKPAGVSLGR